MSMTDVYYNQCAECKRLVAVNPMANVAYGDCNHMTMVGVRALCWQCTEKAKETLGIVPRRESVSDLEEPKK